MYLRSITMKGFKSFPDRTRLELSPGVSVVVGPNGSGKSNVAEAVLWALGEQSPLAVRGQTMQDVIWAGGPGRKSRAAAEVEVVIDNSDGALASEFSELSIVRRLECSGDGAYRLNGARCRLVDVLEALSDTGLGKEMHSVVSQGRVEAIVHSKPRDRRLLIEEAAGLGKHRKRRRRAQLKLERTEANLSRALDVEREARSRLRPLRRQAEAAELHERLERQSLEARLALAAERLRAVGSELGEAESAAGAACAERDEAEGLLAEVAARREATEEAFAAHGREREAGSSALFAARSALDRIELRLERAHDTGAAASGRAERRRRELDLLEETAAGAPESAGAAERIASLESELEALGAGRGGDAAATRRDVERALEAARGEAARLEAELAAAGSVPQEAALTALRRAGAAVQRALREVEAAAEAIWRAERVGEAPGEGGDAPRRAQLEAELRAERLLAERDGRERVEQEQRGERLRAWIERDGALAAAAERIAGALEASRVAVAERCDALTAELRADEAVGESTAAELRACAREEAELQARLRRAAEAVTEAEVRAQRVRDAAGEAGSELERLAARLEVEAAPGPEPLSDAERADLEARIERLARRREQLGPVNPLAKREYEDAVAHVEELEAQRRDLESALAELEGLVADIDRRIRESFEQTFDAAARSFEEVVQHLFPGGRGGLRLVRGEGPRPVIGGEPLPAGEEPAAAGEGPEGPDGPADAADAAEEAPPVEEPGVEVEVTPAGKSTRRLSLLSGGEKSLVALAFLFAVFLARPCPFYILDEVEAALDDVNIDRFLELLRRYSDRAQFIVVTHQKLTMDAADCLYGVSMGADGVSRVVSRRLAPDLEPLDPAGDEDARAAA